MALNAKLKVKANNQQQVKENSFWWKNKIAGIRTSGKILNQNIKTDI